MNNPEWIKLFISYWNSSDSLDEFLDRYPNKIKRKSASVMASQLRKEGYELKKLTPLARRPKPERMRLIEVALKFRNLGATYEEIAILMGVSKQAVHLMLAAVEIKPPAGCYLGWEGCTDTADTQVGDGWVCLHCHEAMQND